MIPEEVDALAGLGEVNRELVRELGRRCPDQRIATADQDATIIESHKRQAFSTYEGERDRKTRSRCATWRFAFFRGRRNCLPTAIG